MPSIHRHIEAFLQEEEDKLREEHGPSSGDVHASQLGLCPKQHALKRAGTEPDFPSLLPENSPMLLYLFHQGRAWQRTVEEALGVTAEDREVPMEYWYVVDPLDPAAHPPVRVTGRVDMFWHDTPVEVKLTRARRTSIPEHWLYQLGFYMMASHSKTGWLVIGYPYFFSTVVVRIVDGELVAQENDKQLAVISDWPEAIRAAAARHAQYTLDPADKPPPYPSPFDHWQCLRRSSRIRCPRFNICWGTDYSPDDRVGKKEFSV